MSVRIEVIGAEIMGADHVNTLHRFVHCATVAAVADVALANYVAFDQLVGSVKRGLNSFSTAPTWSRASSTRPDSPCDHDSHDQHRLRACNLGSVVPDGRCLQPTATVGVACARR